MVRTMHSLVCFNFASTVITVAYHGLGQMAVKIVRPFQCSLLPITQYTKALRCRSFLFRRLVFCQKIGDKIGLNVTQCIWLLVVLGDVLEI